VPIEPVDAVHPPMIGSAPGIDPIEVFSHVTFFNGV
jgi:hypothetical protein